MQPKFAHVIPVSAENGTRGCLSQVERFLARAVKALGLQVLKVSVREWQGASTPEHTSHKDPKKRGEAASGFSVTFESDDSSEKTVVALAAAVAERGQKMKAAELGAFLDAFVFPSPPTGQQVDHRLRDTLAALSPGKEQIAPAGPVADKPGETKKDTGGKPA
ncbi:MAG TPA: hypothetical protein VGF17_29430 [Phytomonospora sp.]